MSVCVRESVSVSVSVCVCVCVLPEQRYRSLVTLQ